MGEKIKVPGIEIEVNNMLALKPFNTKGKKPEECINKELPISGYLPFLERGHKAYPMNRKIYLVEIDDSSGDYSEPVAEVRIRNYTIFSENKGEIWTRGHYTPVEVYENDRKNK